MTEEYGVDDTIENGYYLHNTMMTTRTKTGVLEQDSFFDVEFCPKGQMQIEDGGDCVRLSIPVGVMRGLMESGALCAADVRCLDSASKEAVRRMCLECCCKRRQPACPVPVRVDIRNLGNQ